VTAYYYRYFKNRYQDVKTFTTPGIYISTLIFCLYVVIPWENTKRFRQTLLPPTSGIVV